MIRNQMESTIGQKWSLCRGRLDRYTKNINDKGLVYKDFRPVMNLQKHITSNIIFIEIVAVVCAIHEGQ
jgi:hypothetical protein